MTRKKNNIEEITNKTEGLRRPKIVRQIFNLDFIVSELQECLPLHIKHCYKNHKALPTISKEVLSFISKLYYPISINIYINFTISAVKWT